MVMWQKRRLDYLLRFVRLMILVVVWTTCQQVVACRIPVFRYALERWAPGNYQAIIVHDEPLTELQQQWMQKLRDQSRPGSHVANISVETLQWRENVADQSDNDQSVLLGPDERATLEGIAKPALLVRYPSSHEGGGLVWVVPFSAESVNQLVDSPLRQQIAERLLAGDSAVWVLLECGDPARDEAAATLLHQELERMKSTIQLPALEELAQEEEFIANAKVPLKLDFSLVRLRRDDAQESAFRAMLLQSEADLVGFDDPIAIPVYGRGRTYFALVGKGISASNIESNSRFVCGDCSCQIKDQNPGVDLLFSIDWDARVGAATALERTLPDVSGIGSLDVIDLGTVEAMQTKPTEVASASEVAAQPTSESTPQADIPVAATVAPAEHVESIAPSSPQRSVIRLVIAGIVLLGLIITAGSVYVVRQAQHSTR